MTLSDLDLEARLRDQRTRVDGAPPVPSDLAQRVRERAREQRRRRIALTAAGIAAALVFVGLPTLASGLVGGDSHGDSAAPSPRRPAANYVPPLNDLPTRGSLADDEEWVAAVRGLSWRSPEFEEQLPAEVLPELPNPTGERQVAFAGDVPGGRVALVLGLDDHGALAHAWFVGPERADPEDLILAALPATAPERLPVALWTAPDPASDDQVIVVVGHPGDEVRVLTGREVTAAGETRELWQPVPMEDGAGAVSPERPFSWPYGTEFDVRRNGQSQGMYPALDYGRALDHGVDLYSSSQEPVAVADPRGLLDVVDANEVQWAAESLLAHYGLPADQLRPTLLAGGPVGPGSSTSAVLVGITFPSGATTTQLLVQWGADDGMTSVNVLPDPAPAGTALLDRTIAVATTNALVISGPFSGITAEAYRADGTLLTTVPLVDGAGLAPLSPPSPSNAPLAMVRILDARGGLVAEVPVEQGR